MAKELKIRRVAKDLTQKDLAKKSGVSRATISAIERGSTEAVNMSTLKKLATALDCTVADFFAEKV